MSTCNGTVDPEGRKLEILYEVSKLLNTGLTQEQLTICVRLLELGVNPEALAVAVKHLRQVNKELQKENIQQ